MSDMSRKEAIEVLKDIVSKPMLYSNFIMGACRVALASLETDEAYQLEYERTTKNDLGVDAISRQQAIDAFPALLPNMGYNKKAITEILQEVPLVTLQEPRWIPVSERLPEDSGEYFVTVIDEDVETYKHTEIAWYAHPKDYDVEEGDWRELMIDEKVIAWMPLPQPYREVEE